MKIKYKNQILMNPLYENGTPITSIQKIKPDFYVKGYEDVKNNKNLPKSSNFKLNILELA